MDQKIIIIGPNRWPVQFQELKTRQLKDRKKIKRFRILESQVNPYNAQTVHLKSILKQEYPTIRATVQNMFI